MLPVEGSYLSQLTVIESVCGVERRRLRQGKNRPRAKLSALLAGWSYLGGNLSQVGRRLQRGCGSAGDGERVVSAAGGRGGLWRVRNVSAAHPGAPPAEVLDETGAVKGPSAWLLYACTRNSYSVAGSSCLT